VTPTENLAALSEPEIAALVDGAAWYAKYHQRFADKLADDPSAVAMAKREHFRNLFSGLGKLGIRMRVPQGIDTP
jgi:hypothetical protein